MLRLLFIAFIIAPLLSLAQGDTLYYTANNIRSTKEHARFLEVSRRLDAGKYQVNTYIINTGRLYRTVHLSSLQPPVYDGLSITFHENGDTVIGNYAGSYYTGEVREYYGAGQKQLWCSYNMKNGLLHGSLISYYPNGKVKRRARYTKDHMMQGIQYDEQGNEVPYTEFNIMPEPMFNVKKYLAQNLRYPPGAIEEGIEGTVNVQFMIDENGKIKEATVPEPVHPLLDAEAIRVVNGMKLWKSGSKDDVSVSMYFTLPVYFEL